MRYAAEDVPLVVLAGKEYGTGSSRDWAAKGTALLGVRAVIAESFERIHRSNLIGMGVLPLQFADGDDRRFARPHRPRDVLGPWPRRQLPRELNVRAGTTGPVHVPRPHRHAEGADYYRNGGILQYVLRQLAHG